MAGLLDFLDTPDGRLGLGLLAAAGPSMQPMSFGQRLAGGMQAFREQQAAEQDRALRRQFMDAQMQSMQATAEDRKTAAEERRRQQEREQAIAAWRSGLMQGATPEQVLAGGGGPTVANADKIGAQIDPQTLLARVRAGVAAGLIKPEEAKAIIESQDWGRREVAGSYDVAGPDGSKQTQFRDKYGSPVGTAVDAYTAPQLLDLGGSKSFVVPKVGQSFNVTMTPSEIDASRRGWSANAISRDRLNFDMQQHNSPKPQIVDGQFVYPPSQQNPQGAAVPIQGFAKSPGEAAKKQLSGIDALRGSIDEYVSQVDDWSNRKMLMPDQRARMGTVYNNMMLQAKEAYNLGVLNGPDYTILTSIVADPTKPASAFLSKDALKTQATELKRIMGIVEKAVNGQGKHSAATAVPTMRWNPQTNSLEEVR